jgi:hypothetical protein
MCGASKEQKQISAEQNAFYQQLTQQYATVFGEQQAILATLTKEFEPILSAGPNQRGFSDAERTSLNTTAEEGVARNYEHALRAERENAAAAGGGSELLPSGGQELTEAEYARAGAEQTAAEEQQIEQADYATGRANFYGAEQALAGAAGLLSPVSYAGVANNAGEAASKTAADIAAANNAWMGPVFGAVGGVLGGLAGNPAIFGGGKRG